MKLTESHLRNIIKQELKKTLKEMHGYYDPQVDPQVDDALYNFLDNEAEIDGIYPIAELAAMFKTTPEKIITAYNEGGNMFRPYGYWTEMQGDAIVKTDDSEAA